VRPLVIIALFVLFMLGMDLYALRGIEYLFSFGIDGNPLFYYIYWGMTLLTMGIFLMLYVPKLLFNATQLMGDLASLVSALFRFDAGSLRKWFLLPGLLLGLLTFIAFGMGMISGRTNLKVFRETIKIKALPESFDGLRIVQFSDISLNGASLEITGVENWGKPPFPQHGELQKAMSGVNSEHVKILLSHDPSHWDLQVRAKKDIALTLSGHTHGMQFGIEIGKFRWSPSQWTYKHWAGLYGENGQQLYVNRGLGYTGFPGRVGIRPEITLLTLQKD